MALDFTTKVDIRRHLRVPFAGYPTSGYYGGIRTVLTVGQLEYYMNNLQVEEECVLTGNPFGRVVLNGEGAVGDVVTATINGTPVSYTVTAANLTNPTIYDQPVSPLDAICWGWANAINQAALGPVAAGGLNFKATPPVTTPPPGQLTLVRYGQTFTLSASVISAGLSVTLVANGSNYPNPQSQIPVASAQTVIYGYVPICNALENLCVTQNGLSLWLKQAETVQFRRDEVPARVQVYRWWCKQLGTALSVGPAPYGVHGGASDWGAKVIV